MTNATDKLLACRHMNDVHVLAGDGDDPRRPGSRRPRRIIRCDALNELGVLMTNGSPSGVHTRAVITGSDVPSLSKTILISAADQVTCDNIR
jgi:hypothetical protein